MDTKGFHYSVKFTDRVKFFIQQFEEDAALAEQHSRKVGKNPDGSFYICDMKNFSFATATDKQTIQDSIYLTRMFQDHYPEHLKKLIVINDDWKPVLLKFIDADILPAFLGGNKTDADGDPMCKSFISHGGPIPEHLHICKSKNSLSNCKEAKKLVIPRAAFNEIELDVEEPGSIIEWEFEIKSRDIGFGLFLNERNAQGEEKITELVPLLRLDTEEFSETGMFKCEKSGKYVILFDNSYSWIRAKEIYYKVKVVTLKQHESNMIF